MKCPLRFRLQNITSGEGRIYTGECLKEECAWFYDAENCCSVLRLNRHLAAIASTLQNIAKELTLVRGR